MLLLDFARKPLWLNSCGGSESLLRVNLTQRGVRAKLLSHDELVGSYGNACKLGWLLAIYLSCESEINRLVALMEGSPVVWRVEKIFVRSDAGT